ncbi:hypothetical protein LCGC14_0509340 [marine sediment metagenome]|uniref:Uncharacterized protein n=1 Tax=marine sediment metagenome TaxID=412755 RepID=A0A0F9VA01_9ZZZZ
MPKLKFIDMRTKIPFETDKFEIKFTKKGGKMAQAIAPSGAKSTRFVKKDFVK